MLPPSNYLHQFIRRDVPGYESGMIIGHRTLPDSDGTVVFRVAFPGKDLTDTFEMKRSEVEDAIHKYMTFERTCREAACDWISDEEDGDG